VDVPGPLQDHRALFTCLRTVNELMNIQVLYSVFTDIYPELVAEDYVKKSAEDTSNRTSLISQQQQQAAVVGPSAAAGASKVIGSSEAQSATTSGVPKTSSGALPVDGKQAWTVDIIKDRSIITELCFQSQQ